MREFYEDHSKFRLSGDKTDCEYFGVTDTKSFSSDKIRAIRLSHGLSLEIFAHKIGVSERTARRWEKEECEPRYIAVNAIKRFLKGAR